MDDKKQSIFSSLNIFSREERAQYLFSYGKEELDFFLYRKAITPEQYVIHLDNLAIKYNINLKTYTPKSPIRFKVDFTSNSVSWVNNRSLYYNLLKLYGYHDIDCTLTFKMVGAKFYFWNGDTRYELNITNYDANQDKKHSDDEFANEIRNFEILSLFNDNSFKGENITLQLTSHLKTSGFEQIDISWQKKSATCLYSTKSNIKTYIYLSVVNAAERYRKLREYHENEEPYEERYPYSNYQEVQLLLNRRLTNLEKSDIIVTLLPDRFEDLTKVHFSIKTKNRVAKLDICIDSMFNYTPDEDETIQDIIYDIAEKCCFACQKNNNPYNDFYSYVDDDIDSFMGHMFVDSNNYQWALLFYEEYEFLIHIDFEEEINFDSMTGIEFELFCAKLLKANSFENVTLTQGSGDQGVDIIAYKDEIKYGIQCKCYSGDIGNKAVQEVYSGKTYYQCHIGVVLTNRRFTRSAIELATNTGIILWDREKLIKMIDIYRKNE